jgi:hypothetical protein
MEQRVHAFPRLGEGGCLETAAGPSRIFAELSRSSAQFAANSMTLFQPFRHRGIRRLSAEFSQCRAKGFMRRGAGSTDHVGVDSSRERTGIRSRTLFTFSTACQVPPAEVRAPGPPRGTRPPTRLMTELLAHQLAAPLGQPHLGSSYGSVIAEVLKSRRYRRSLAVQMLQLL